MRKFNEFCLKLTLAALCVLAEPLQHQPCELDGHQPVFRLTGSNQAKTVEPPAHRAGGSNSATFRSGRYV